MRDYLDFELPLKDIQVTIDEISEQTDNLDKNLIEKISKLQKKYHQTQKRIFRQLTPLQVLQLARHPNRPHSSDYIRNILTDFQPLHTVIVQAQIALPQSLASVILNKPP